MTTTLNTTETIFVNLFAAIKAEKFKQLKDFSEDLNLCNSVEEILKSWKYNDLLPKGKKEVVSGWALGTVKQYLTERKEKEHNKYLAAKLRHLQTVQQAPDLISITVSMEWKKSRMWGSNPTAEAKVHLVDQYEYFNSGSIGGCGYDKGSTAVANAVNQCNSFLKALYMVKEANPSKSNHDLFGYGSGYGILPSLEGGVGVSCYPSIFGRIGFSFRNTASGKTFDVYEIHKNPAIGTIVKIDGKSGEYTGFSEITGKHHFSMYDGSTKQERDFRAVTY